FSRRLGEHLVRTHARNRAPTIWIDGKIAWRSERSNERRSDSLSRMADQRPARRAYCEGTTGTRGTLAGRQGSCASLWPAAGVLPAVAKLESRGRLVARESSNLRPSRCVRLDYEPRRFRIDRGVCEPEWRSGVLLRNPEHGSHISTLFECGRRIQRKARTVRSKYDWTANRLAAE